MGRKSWLGSCGGGGGRGGRRTVPDRKPRPVCVCKCKPSSPRVTSTVHQGKESALLQCHCVPDALAHARKSTINKARQNIAQVRLETRHSTLDRCLGLPYEHWCYSTFHPALYRKATSPVGNQTESLAPGLGLAQRWLLRAIWSK